MEDGSILRLQIVGLRSCEEGKEERVEFQIRDYRKSCSAIVYQSLFSSLYSAPWAPFFAVWKYVSAYAAGYAASGGGGGGKRRKCAVKMEEMKWDCYRGIWKISCCLWLDLYVTVETRVKMKIK
ncbi:Uncharacterized protein Adt_22935 [Abeliophyllum distichum]|uniref:Uncharacterized protein n=1 Tax=Abeliophyllum distichum TaxID=126358 RepID=A0ABD1S9U3_9LAMI